MAFALVTAACSGSSGSATPSTTLVRAITTTSLVLDTPTRAGGASGSDAQTRSSTPAPIAVAGLQVSAVFPAIAQIDPDLSFRELSSGDLDRLEARFRQDDRVGVFLFDVGAMGVYQGEELIAVAVSVAVTPAAASTPGFSESFIMGATSGGALSPLPLVVLDQDLTSWTTVDADHLLWSHENLFLIVSGADPLAVRHVASAIVTMIIDPPEPSDPPVVDTCPDPEPVEGEPADAEDEAVSPEVVSPEDCVAADTEASTTTTTEP